MTIRTTQYLISAVILFLVGLLPAQDRPLTIMAYNVLNFNQGSGDRVDDFVTVFSATQPDIVVVNEMQSQAGMDLMLQQGFSNEYAAGPFRDGPDTDNAVYYKDGRVTLDSVITITTELRDITGYRFIIDDHQDPSFRFTVFSAHLKASPGYDDRRYQETLKLAQYIANQDSNYYYAFAGDFNFYGAGEAGYKLLLDSLAVDLEDPLGARGEWNNDSSYSYLHTQSTRTAHLPDLGAWGGLDDRFDFILLSHHMLRDSGPLTYVTGTYNAYGNDGNHFNGEINSGTNGVVSAAIADALYYASDHLPVMLELSYPTTMTVADGVARPVTYALHQNYPNPFNPGTMIQFDLPVGSDTRIAVYDLLGREVVRLADGRLEPGYHQLLWNGRDTRGRAVPTGMYIVLMMTPEFGKNIKVLLLR